MLEPERSYTINSTAKYRFGFQRQENDNELKGLGNMIHFTFREYDPRIARFFAVDPLVKKYPELSPYVFSGNNVIHTIELEGAEPLDDLGIGDHKGFFQSSSKDEYETNPLGAGLKDGSFMVAKLLGIDLIDNLIADYNDPNLSTEQKIHSTTDAIQEMMTPSRGPIKGEGVTTPKISTSNAAKNLPQMKGKSISHIEKALEKDGFNKIKQTSTNQTWNHSDGSEIRVHPYGNKVTSEYKSANNAHIHKENPTGDQLNDRGIISNDPSKTHIGIKNPKDLPLVRDRIHGQGSK